MNPVMIITVHQSKCEFLSVHIFLVVAYSKAVVSIIHIYIYHVHVIYIYILNVFYHAQILSLFKAHFDTELIVNRWKQAHKIISLQVVGGLGRGAVQSATLWQNDRTQRLFKDN